MDNPKRIYDADKVDKLFREDAIRIKALETALEIVENELRRTPGVVYSSTGYNMIRIRDAVAKGLGRKYWERPKKDINND